MKIVILMIQVLSKMFQNHQKISFRFDTKIEIFVLICKKEIVVDKLFPLYVLLSFIKHWTNNGHPFGGSFFGIKIHYMKVLNMGFCKNAFCQGVEWHDHLEVTTGNPRWLLVLLVMSNFIFCFICSMHSPVQFPPFVIWRCKNSFKPTKNCKIV